MAPSNKNKLTDVTDKDLVCYKCGIEKAEKGKPFKTPTGGVFWRGWCNYCLNGIPVESRSDSEAVINASYGLKPGQVVTATLTGKFLHPVPKTGEAVILVGTRGYTVPMSSLPVEIPEEEEVDDTEEVGAGADSEEPTASD